MNEPRFQLLEDLDVALDGQVILSNLGVEPLKGFADQFGREGTEFSRGVGGAVVEERSFVESFEPFAIAQRRVKVDFRL
jgi:hypothetical protein